MRRIQTASELNRKEQRNKRLFSLFMLALLLFSTVGFAFLYRSEDNGAEEKNPSGVVQTGENQWSVKLGDGQVLTFRNSPEDVKDIPIDPSIDMSLYSSGIIYVDANKTLYYQEISYNLGRYVERMQPACYGKCGENLPEKNCSDNMIVFRESKLQKVYKQEKCVFIEGDMKAVDAFLYRLFGLQ